MDDTKAGRELALLLAEPAAGSLLPARTDEEFAERLAMMAAAVERNRGTPYHGTTEEILHAVVRDVKWALDRLVTDVVGDTERGRAVQSAFGQYLGGASGLRMRRRAKPPEPATLPGRRRPR